jgi:hypothetical protein
MHSKDYLCRLFKYEDGRLYWIDHDTQPSRFIGKEAGHIRKDGYIFVKINYKSIAVHKIIWCMFNGVWVDYPINEIDHIDRNPSNNRIENLRVVTKSQNQDNTKCRGNSTGTKGVYYDNSHRLYKAVICVNKINRHLGYYKTLEDAINTRKQAEESKNEGNFDSWYKRKRKEFLG